MSIVDRVKCPEHVNALAWRYPSDELSTWTQLIVSETQEAYLVRDGIYDGPYGPGRHTLSTENIPVLRRFIGLPFGGKTPFSAEVWFIDRTTKMDLKWGTPAPIQLRDPVFNISASLIGFGQYGIEVCDSKRLLLRLVGQVRKFSIEDVNNYFRGLLGTALASIISKYLEDQRVSVIDINTRLLEISHQIQSSFRESLDPFGLRLSNFSIQSLNTLDDDPSIAKIKTALGKVCKTPGETCLSAQGS
jgi:membrane protease subunit (stomatin/prohibitin family)